MICPQCEKTEMVAKTEKASVSAGGLFGALIGIFGLVLLLLSPVVGLLTIIVGIVIGMAGRTSKTILICPACRHTITL